MTEQKTQQFAKFFLSDIKLKFEKNKNKKSTLEELDVSTAS